MADMIPQGVQREGIDGGYERGDANIRSVVLSMVIILSATVIVMIVALGGFFALRAREEAKDVPPSQVYARVIPPEPRLLPAPITARDNMLPWERGALEMTEQKESLQNYGITDATRGQFTIPVDRAMQDVIRQNLPARQVPASRNDLAQGIDTGAQPVADADMDGSMVPDTTGGRVLDDEALAGNAPSYENAAIGNANLAASSVGETHTKTAETGVPDVASGNPMGHTTPRPRVSTPATTTRQNAQRTDRYYFSTVRRNVPSLGTQ